MNIIVCQEVCKEITEVPVTRFADSPLGKRTEGKTFDQPSHQYDQPLGLIQIVENKREGTKREEDALKDLQEKYPNSKGYQIVREAYLRDQDGNIVKDPETGEARRIDFVVVQDGKVVESVEVTSKTAPKETQCAKEERIRENGGNYIKLPDGSLAQFSQEVSTTIDRRN